MPLYSLVYSLIFSWRPWESRLSKLLVNSTVIRFSWYLLSLNPILDLDIHTTNLIIPFWCETNLSPNEIFFDPHLTWKKLSLWSCLPVYTWRKRSRVVEKQHDTWLTAMGQKFLVTHFVFLTFDCLLVLKMAPVALHRKTNFSVVFLQ